MSLSQLWLGADARPKVMAFLSISCCHTEKEQTHIIRPSKVGEGNKCLGLTNKTVQHRFSILLPLTNLQQIYPLTSWQP